MAGRLPGTLLLRLAACISHSTLMPRPGPTSLAMHGRTARMASLPMATSFSLRFCFSSTNASVRNRLPPGHAPAASSIDLRGFDPVRPADWRNRHRCYAQYLISFPPDPSSGRHRATDGCIVATVRLFPGPTGHGRGYPALVGTSPGDRGKSLVVSAAARPVTAMAFF